MLYSAVHKFCPLCSVFLVPFIIVCSPAVSSPSICFVLSPMCQDTFALKAPKVTEVNSLVRFNVDCLIIIWLFFHPPLTAMLHVSSAPLVLDLAKPILLKFLVQFEAILVWLIQREILILSWQVSTFEVFHFIYLAWNTYARWQRQITKSATDTLFNVPKQCIWV